MLLKFVAESIVASVSALDLYLTSRQLAVHSVAVPPSNLFSQAIIKDADEFHKSQSYQKDKLRFTMIRGLFSAMKEVFCLHFDVFPYLFDLAGDITGNLGYGDMARSIAFVGLTFALDQAFSIPFSLYSTFVLEEKHGFNRTTMRTFVADRIKVWMLTAVFGTPITAAIHWISAKGLAGTGAEFSKYWFYCWGFTFATIVTMTLIAPSVIMPLFNKYVPVEKGTSLRTKVDALAESVGFPLTELYEMDGSKRSSHSNAFLFGLSKSKRIVLFDTLKEQVGEDGIVAILSHELGHWAHSDTYKNLFVSQTYLAFFFAAFAYSARNGSKMLTEFGYSDASPAKAPLVLLTVFSTLFTPVDQMFQFGMNAFVRRIEYAADGYAVSLGYAAKLKEALIAIHRENLSALIHDPLYSAYHYSHPTLLERIDAIDAAVAKDTKKTE